MKLKNFIPLALSASLLVTVPAYAAPVRNGIDTGIEEEIALASIIYNEARGEDETGRRLVADVILNRVEDSRWPDTISGVIHQPYQFADNGTRWNNECLYAAVREMYGERIDNSIHYFSNGRLYNGAFAYIHGGHFFGR